MPPGSPRPQTVDKPSLLRGVFPESIAPFLPKSVPLLCPAYRLTLFPRSWEPWESPDTQHPHRPPRASPRLLAWTQVLWVHTRRLLLGCTKQRGECQRQSTRQKLISGDISPDSGAVLAISSNSVAPSIKAYCPLMGNLQTEFDFFIKNQQAADEKGSPGFSYLLLLAQA